jgi:lipopolysaccharide export system protein LptA
MTIEADLLTAHKRDKVEGQKKDKIQEDVAGDLDFLTAEGNVFIHTPTQKIFGQKGVYDLDKKLIKITGNNLKYMTENDVVTAQDSLEYYEDKGVAVARGKALALHAGSRIEADILSATFAQGASGQREMKKMMAKGHVVIITKEGNVARSKRAVYDVKRDVALLLDEVKLKQGETLLAGDRAEVDFKTGQSRLLNAGGGRVRALLSSKGEEKAK